jgi:hypothetical protein
VRRQVRLVVAAAALGALGAGCSRDKGGAPAEGATHVAGAEAAGARVPAGPPVAQTEYFRVDAVEPSCVAGAPCEAKLVLTATGGFHVNKDYPFKFVADTAAASAVAVETAAFASEGEHRGTMTIKLAPTKAGPAEVRGTFKFSVCDDDTCKIEEPAIAIPTVVRSPAG